MNPIILDYATLATARPPSNVLRIVSLATTSVTGGVGLAILGLYAITAAEPLPLWGFFWLAIGGIATLVALVCGITYAALGASRKFPPPSSSGRAGLAVALPLLNFGVALVCVFAGTGLMQYHADSIVIYNAGSQTIDAVELYSPSFGKSIGPLRQGQTIRVHHPHLPLEFLRMRVHVGTGTTPYDVSASMASDQMFGSRFVTLRGLDGYVNRMGSQAP